MAQTMRTTRAVACSATTAWGTKTRPRPHDGEEQPRGPCAPRAIAARRRESVGCTPVADHVPSAPSALRENAVALHQQRGDDHDEKDDTHDRRRGRGVPAHDLLDDAQADAGDQRSRQRLHPRHDRGGQRRQEHGGTVAGDARGHSGERRFEDEGEGGKAAHDHPHDGGVAPHGNAEQKRPALGSRPRPEPRCRCRSEQEPPQAEQHDRRDEAR